MTAYPDDLHGCAMRLRHMAGLHEILIGLDTFNDLPARYAEFARTSIALARAAADACDAADRAVRDAKAKLGHPEPPPRPKLEIVV
jgi:hypothetical protein